MWMIIGVVNRKEKKKKLLEGEKFSHRESQVSQQRTRNKVASSYLHLIIYLYTSIYFSFLFFFV